MNSYISQEADQDELAEGYVTLTHRHDETANAYVTHGGLDITAGHYESNDQTMHSHRVDHAATEGDVESK